MPITPEVLRKQRLRASLAARGMTLEEREKQMLLNGSIPRPNPWLSGRENIVGFGQKAD